MDEQYAKRRGITMVKVGFIVEGTSDFIILKSDKFQNLLKYKLEIDTNESLINIARSRPRLKKNFVSLVRNLQKQNVNYIFTLVDQDDKKEQRRNRGYRPSDCPIVVVNEIQNFRDNRNYIFEENSFVIMTREMEAWFLADENLGFNFEGQPEEILNPSDVVAGQLGTSSHVKIANRLKDRFSLVRASENSSSAKRFLDKLEQIADED
jgi:hypothetical protein